MTNLLLCLLCEIQLDRAVCSRGLHHNECHTDTVYTSPDVPHQISDQSVPGEEEQVPPRPPVSPTAGLSPIPQGGRRGEVGQVSQPHILHSVNIRGVQCSVQ